MNDLKSLEVNPDKQLAEFVPQHPVEGGPIEDEEGNALKLMLRGPDSTQVKRVQREYQSKLVTSGISGRNKNKTFDVEEMQQKAMDVCVAATADWENVLYEGEVLEANEGNIRMVYEKLPWLREQVQEFINDRGNFLGK